MKGPSANSEEARLGHIIDAFLAGALLAGIIDWLASGPRIESLVFVLCIAMVAGLFAALAVWLAAWLSKTIDRSFRGWLPAVLSIAGSVALVSPLAYVVFRMLPALTLAVFLSVAALLSLLGVAFFVFGRNAASPTAWALASIGCSTLVFVVGQSMLLFDRIRPDAFDLRHLLVIGGTAGSVILAFAATQLVQFWHGTPSPRLLRITSAVLGVAGMFATTLVGKNYPTSRRGMIVVVAVLVGLGTSGLRLPRLARWLAVVGALVGVGWLALTSPLSDLRVAVVEQSVIARELLTATKAFKPGMLREVKSLGQRSEASLRPGLAEEALAWNRRKARLSGSLRGKSVLLITVDALRYDRLDCFSERQRGVTPEIDKLAAGAIRFRRCYAQGGWTALSLPSMMWSRYPSEVDLREATSFELVTGVHVERTYVTVADEHKPNLAALMAKAGFRTIAVPHDSHTGFFDPRLGFVRGFSRVVYPRTEARTRGRRGPTDDRFAVDLAIEQLRSHDWRTPLFMWVHLFEPHGPAGTAPEPGRFSGYYGDLHYVDHQVGRLLHAVDSLGRREKTLVVLTGDHGEALGERGEYGHGLSLYDECMRVPLLLDLPGQRSADVGQPVGIIDVAPTILDLVGVQVPLTMRGFKLTHVIDSTPESVRPPVLMETWRSEAGAKSEDRCIDLVGLVANDEKVVLDRRSWVFRYAHVDGKEAALPMSTGSQRNERFMRLAARLLGWLCRPSGGADGRRCPW